MVIAETPAAARDGAERVAMEWAPLPAVTASLAAAAPGAPVVWDGDQVERVRGCEDRRCRGGGRRVRSCRPRGPARYVGAAGHRRAHGAARRGRRLGPGERPVHRPRGRRGPGPDTDRGGRRARRTGERGARDGARGGRELRHAQQLLSGVRPGRLGRAAPRPAREVDGRTARGVPGRLRGPRSRGPGRAGARRRGRFLAVSRRQHQQRGRPRRLVPPAQQGHGPHGHGLPRSRRRPCTGAPWSPTRRRPRRTAARGAPRSCSSRSA